MSDSNKTDTGISIILCCYNSASRLPNTLKHLAEQELNFEGSIELIIVDNNSSDNTYSLSKQEWVKLGSPYPQHVLKELRQGQAFARQTGIEKANFNLIAFVDDDNWLEPDYIKTGFEIMERNPKIAVLGGSNIGAFDSPPPAWIDQPFPFKSLRHNLAIHNEKETQGDLTSEKYVFGAGSFYRVDTLDQLKATNFEPLLTGRQKDVLTSGDDEELCYALQMLGFQVMRNPAMKLKHYIPDGRLNWSYFKRMYFGYGLLTPIKEMYQSILESGAIPEKDITLEVTRLEGKMSRLHWLHKITKNLPKLKNLKSELIQEKIKGQLSFYKDHPNLYEKSRNQLLAFHNSIHSNPPKQVYK